MLYQGGSKTKGLRPLAAAAAPFLAAGVLVTLTGCMGDDDSPEREAALTTGTTASEESAGGPAAGAAPRATERGGAGGGGGGGGKPPAGNSPAKQAVGAARWASEERKGKEDERAARAKADEDGTVAPGVEAPAAVAEAVSFRTLEEAVAAGKLDAAVLSTLRRSGRAEAIVTFEYHDVLEDSRKNAPRGKGRDKAVIEAMRPAFKRKKDDAFAAARGIDVLHRWENLPTAFVRIRSEDGLLALLNQPTVLSVAPDRKLVRQSTQHLNYIRQPEVRQAGYTGQGTYVGVLDTGVDYQQYSEFGSCPQAGASTCRVASSLEFAPQDNVLDDSGHGTNVAAIVAKVAPGTRILAMDVFEGEFTGYQHVNSALNQLITWKNQGYRIAAANMSLGSSPPYTYPELCAGSYYAATIAATRNAGILPVVASGNSAGGGANYGIGDPGCAPASLAVGATYDYNVGAASWEIFDPACTDQTTFADKVACFSQTSPYVDMLAPGTQIPGGSGAWTGTSQAAPHVAGAAAVLAAAAPSASLDQIQSALVNSGPLLSDQRYSVRIDRRRLDLAAARAALGGQASADTTPPSVSGPSEQLDGELTASSVQVLLKWSASDASGIKAYSVWSQADGGSWAQAALSSATATSIRYTLTLGHSYRFAVAAQDGAGNWSGYSYSPPLTAAGFGADAQDDGSSAVTLTGSWSRYAWSSAFRGYGLTSSSAGARARFSFTGRGVAWVGPLFSGAGRGRVYLDGSLSGTADTNSASLLPRQVIYWARWPSSGSHTMTVEVEGTSGRPRIDIDAFAVLR